MTNPKKVVKEICQAIRIATTMAMVFKLMQSVQKRWIKLRFAKKARQVWEGIIFEDELETKINKTVDLVFV